MRTCPHCKFLVGDGATSCSVCHAELTAPVRAPAFAAPGAATAAPGAASHPFSSPTAPGPGWPADAGPPPLPPPGSPIVGPRQPGQVPVNKGASTKKVLAIVGALCLVPVVIVAGLVAVISLLGTTSGELAADELFWTPYEHPEGRYTVHMPGDVDAGTVDAPIEGFGLPTELDSAWVTNRDFVTTVARTPDVVPPGQDFDTLPFSASAMEGGIEQLGFEAAELVSHGKVDGATIDAELRGTVDGEDSIFLTRIVIVGPDLYELNVMGAASDEAELRSIHDRLVGSFEPAA